MLGFGWECLCWNDLSELCPQEPRPFSLPSPLPRWPQGQGFATGRVDLGEIEVLKITRFESVWSFGQAHGKLRGVSFYRPIRIPDGYHCLGHYCQRTDKPLRGYVLVARSLVDKEIQSRSDSLLRSPPLVKPLNYTLIWSIDSDRDGSAFFWYPNPPIGYKALGIVVTNDPMGPDIEQVRCVREDLTEPCEPCDLIGTLESKQSGYPIRVWDTRPFRRGMKGKGVSTGTFFCDSVLGLKEQDLEIACLKNRDYTLHAMPNLDQVHALIGHYGPTVFFHPDESYLPSSVEWFFKNGALLYEDGKEKGERIKYDGSNLPCGGCNDGEFWIDLPEEDDSRDFLISGNLDSAELYVHVKPALGGTFTDIVMWVFCPFNGPATLKVGPVSIVMSRVGQHVGDWEHYTLRVSNFTGELWSMYFSEHSGGGWVDASEIEYIERNRPIVYSSKYGHASFPHPGTYLQGSSKLGIGMRNDTARSNIFIDSSVRYRIIAAEYLGGGVVSEPCWLQYMREWGPTVIYDSRSELDKVINLLPIFVRFSVENLFDLFPTELYGEEGPTGPKEKDNWVGDERC
ncbi:uncharacterized protein LOC116208562 [Punica granatum]|uniref:Uncharacterized protein LOC116208562 n=2 Tax=Punica granatum TaxID=22663 RepID=A0A6P8DXJ5_PUNGR|nr:uncharacterized protein LOC116208562 [Punica granatum]PKI39098.1 hypothetical protein CRG98_040522 [Punica granatum]